MTTDNAASTSSRTGCALNQDPVCKSFVRLYNCDLCAMRPACGDRTPNDVFMYKSHQIYRVDVMGLVVSVAEREKFFSYAIDDGTGVIQCCCWKPKRRDEDVAMETPIHDDESELAATLCKKIEDAEDDVLTPCELGDLLHVRGRLKVFRGNIEVSAAYFRRIQDSSFQTEMRRMEELPTLYRSVYDRPFVLPGGLRERMEQKEEEERLGLKREAHIIREVKERLLGLVENRTIQNFYLHELETLRDLVDTASAPCVEYQQGAASSPRQTPAKQIKNVFKSVAEKLEQDGTIFRSSIEHGLYQVVEGNQRLKEAIIEILRSDCKQPKYDGGCHYMHVADRLRNMSGYELISPDAVKGALSWLESGSEVISTTPKHYMAIS